MRSLVAEVVEWVASSAQSSALGVDVPGADEDERRRLAVLGGLALGLGGREASKAWPSAVRSWASSAPMPPEKLLARLKAGLLARSDPLATIYERSISGRSRRSLGTFFTPAVVVDYMLDAADELVPNPTTVIDPGAGVGAFTLAAAARWRSATVEAVDVNVVTLGLLAARATHLGARVHLAHSDFLDWSQSQAHQLPGPRLWIGNPPYTRHQSMSATARVSAGRLDTALVRSGLAGLSAYFLAAILQALRPEDALCLLLPGSWTDTRYGAPLRTRLKTLSQREVGLVGFPSERKLFPGTRVTGMVLVVGPQSSTKKPMWSARADIVDDRVTVLSRTQHDRDRVSEGGFGGWLWSRRASHPVDVVRLSTLARVRRGVATGANRFFLLTDPEAAAMPPRFVRPAVRSLRSIASDCLDQQQHDLLGRQGQRRWLLEIPPQTDLEAEPALLGWRSNAFEPIARTYIGSHREAWYSVEHVESPDILFSPMGKGRMKAVRNLVGAVPSNALYGLYLHNREPEVSDRLCTWLNSEDGQAALLLRARAYGDGLFKLEPKELRDVYVPSATTGILSLRLGPFDDMT